MIYAVVFIIAVLVLISMHLFNKRGTVKGNYTKRLSEFMKWVTTIQEGEKYNFQVINHKITTTSDSITIKYDFSKEKGTLYDNAIEKEYKILYIDGQYNLLNIIK